MASQPSPVSDFIAVDFQNHAPIPMAPPTNLRSQTPSTGADPKTARQILTELSDKFHKFDDAATYQDHVGHALSEKTANFAVRFGVEEADIAIGLNEQDVGALLQVQAEGKDEKVTWM